MASREETGTSSDPSASQIKVQIKFIGRTIPLSVSPDSTVGSLKSLLQPLTNVLIRGQKLIYKGKVLADALTLEQLQILDGSRIMLVASQGLHQGDGPITNDARPITRKTVDVSMNQCHKNSTSTNKTRLDRWKATGVVALSESHLTVVPEEVWACGHSVRVLDVTNNYIKEIPDRINCLKSMTKLLLNANDLLEDNINWEGLSLLKSLKVLSLNQNHLSSLPSVIGTLTSLTQLHVANNKLAHLPEELLSLTHLQILEAGNNRINVIPSSIGNCRSLVEVDFSSNLLKELPETFGMLTNLKVLQISHNGIKSLPTTLFKLCSQLSTLNLHCTEITNDVLRQLEGWEEFDERRQLKHQKQLDFRVGFSGNFDEGADESRKS